MIKYLTCIECPKGCKLEIETEGGRVLSIKGNQCEKGVKYGQNEIENPVRILSSSVLAHGLELKMIPVRTDKPIPKTKLAEAMDKIKQITIVKPVKLGDVIEKDFITAGVSLIATRNAK